MCMKISLCINFLNGKFTRNSQVDEWEHKIDTKGVSFMADECHLAAPYTASVHVVV